MNIAVDFDGTIVEHRYPEIGKELPFAIDTLKKLIDNGHRIILWSVREGKLLDDAVKFCSDRGLEFYAVNCDFPGGAWKDNSQRKVLVDMYIDDRNIGGLPDWPTMYEMITNHLTYADVIERASQDDSVEFHSGTFKSKSSSSSGGSSSRKHRKHRKRGPIGRLIDRCRDARAKFSHR